MSRFVQFPTPENVDVVYELAGIGSRFVAALIDHSIQVLLLVAGGLAIASAGVGLSHLGDALGGAMPYWVTAGLLVWTFVVFWGYFAVFELIWAGRTPGKRIVGLRVVRDSGYPIDPFAVIVRNLVRVVDLMPPVYGAGLLSVFFSPGYKRLGDWAAGTIVIKDRERLGLRMASLGAASPLVAHYLAAVKSAEGLSGEEFHAIRRFAERRHELDIPVQAHLAMRLAEPIVKRLGIDVPVAVQWHYADLLEALARRYVEEHRLL